MGQIEPTRAFLQRHGCMRPPLQKTFSAGLQRPTKVALWHSIGVASLIIGQGVKRVFLQPAEFSLTPLIIYETHIAGIRGESRPPNGVIFPTKRERQIQERLSLWNLIGPPTL